VSPFPREKEDGLLRLSRAGARKSLDVHAVEFSKTVPRSVSPTKKASRAGGPSEDVILGRIRLQAKGAPLVEVYSFVRSRFGSRRMVATMAGVSSGAKPHKLTLSDL
jgi:hypothetical protein